MKVSILIRSIVLLAIVLGTGVGLAAWKNHTRQEAAAAASQYPEPMESVTASLARETEYRDSSTSIGTVMAIRSIALQNELAGTVSKVEISPGQIVEKNALLVAFDVSVEEAELRAQEAQAALAKTLLDRMQRAKENRAASEAEFDRAKAELEVAQAQIERLKAIIARKTIHAPFRARVGMMDLHPGQYLNQGTVITSLQGVDEALHVEFAVPQRVAASLHEGENIEVIPVTGMTAVVAKVVALDARIDPNTRNAMVRARVENTVNFPAPGASVRVRVPVGPPQKAIAIPVNALRKGPAGDHVFIIAADGQGKHRAQLRPVQSGMMIGDEVLIYSGVNAGEQLAASGSFKLRDGLLVNIVDEKAQ